MPDQNGPEAELERAREKTLALGDMEKAFCHELAVLLTQVDFYWAELKAGLETTINQAANLADSDDPTILTRSILEFPDQDKMIRFRAAAQSLESLAILTAGYQAYKLSPGDIRAIAANRIVKAETIGSQWVQRLAEERIPSARAPNAPTPPDDSSRQGTS